MRLTLRTMLAYLDDILDPADGQDVGKKIEESEFATSLMHRMRDVTRRLRLGAPKLHGRGMGHDPNTVAEYLDNTLLSERVADFEKVCLESDVHLAEVASCHQILALVLGEPAEIETTSRQRMYGLINETETADARASTREERKLRDGERSARKKKKRRRPKVPEYLRESAEPEPQPQRWAAIVLVGALLAAVGIGVATYWPEISRRLQVAGYPAVPPPDGAITDSQANQSGQPAANDNQRADNSQGGDRVGGPPSDASAEGEQPSDRADEEAARSAPDQSTETASDERPAATSGNKKPRSARSAAETKTDEGATLATVPDEQPIARPARATKRPATNESEESAPSGEGVGRLISDHDVLLRKADEQWQRVPARATVYAGQRLIALPTYRPSVAMSSGVTLQLLGGAIVSLGATDEDGAAQIRLDSGRLLLLTVAKPGAKIHLKAGDYQGTIEFGKDEAALAVEVQRALPEGADPEEEAAPATVDLYLASGEATWVDAKGRSDTLRGRAHRSLTSPKAAGKASDEMPVWIEEGELNPMERRASTEVESFLRADKPVAPAVTELATHRKIENSQLAAQCLALIDEFEPIVPLLNDPKYRVAWTPQIESLRAAIARGPKTAALVREAITTVRGKKLGDQLYRMLWGFNAQQLQDGAAEQLISWLDAPDDQLDFRVLSFWNLHHITGLGLYYRPEDPEKTRRTPIQKWKQKLESGLIVPKAT